MSTEENLAATVYTQPRPGIFAAGINPSTQMAEYAGELSDEQALEILREGLVVVPAPAELCKAAGGTHIPKPYALALGMLQAHRSPLAHIAITLGMDENTKSHQICRAIGKLQKRLERPLDVVLHCPACKQQHIDGYEEGGWNNRPHKTHLCHFCGELWTPAQEPTNGVRAVKPGSSATWPRPDVSLFSPELLPARDEAGMTYHPDLPDVGEEEDVSPYLWALGYEAAFIDFESDASQELQDEYSEDLDVKVVAKWTPTPPEGAGWRLATIYDTENGAYAMFVRPCIAASKGDQA